MNLALWGTALFGDRELGNRAVVEVLLATFNGERFLREQVDSILTQDYENVQVLARDDGSSDGTVKMLNEYAERYPARFRVVSTSPGTGSAKANFLRLMKASTADYICFSDQDDVWLPDKVSRTKQAMDRLESEWGANTPLLVFTDLRIVDNQLRPVHESFWAHERIMANRIKRLPSLLVQNVVTGCTAMLNRRLLEISLTMPAEAVMHDHWVALLACLMGKSAMVKDQTVLYRQHDRNVLGAGKRIKTLGDLIRRVRRSTAREMQWENSQRQGEALLKMHSAEISENNRRLLKMYKPRGTSRSRILRMMILICFGFCRFAFRKNLAMLFDLWTMAPRQVSTAAGDPFREPDGRPR